MNYLLTNKINHKLIKIYKQHKLGAQKTNLGLIFMALSVYTHSPQKTLPSLLERAVPQDSQRVREALQKAAAASTSQSFVTAHVETTAYTVQAVALSVINIPLYLTRTLYKPLRHIASLEGKKALTSVSDNLSAAGQSFLLTLSGIFLIAAVFFFPKRVFQEIGPIQTKNQQQLSTLEAKNAQLHKKKHSLKKELSKLRNNVRNLSQKLEDRERTIASQKTSLDFKREGQISKLQNQLKAAEKKLSEQEQFYKDLLTSTEQDLQKQNVHIEGLGQEIQKHKNLLNTHKASEEALQATRLQSAAEIRQLIKERGTLARQLQEKTEEHSQALNTLREKATWDFGQEELINSSKEKFQKLEQQFTTLLRDKSTLDKRLEENEQTHSENLRQLQHALHTTVEEREAVIREKDGLSEELSIQSEEIKVSRDRLLAELTEAKREFDEELSSTKKTHQGTILKLEKENEELSQEYEKLTIRLHGLMKNLEEMDKTGAIETLTSDLATAQGQVDQKELEYKHIKKVMKRLQKESLQEAQKQTSLTEQNAHLTKEIRAQQAKQEQQHTSDESKIQELLKEKESLTEQLQTKEEEYTLAKQTVQSLQNELDTEIKTHLEALEELNQRNRETHQEYKKLVTDTLGLENELAALDTHCEEIRALKQENEETHHQEYLKLCDRALELKDQLATAEQEIAELKKNNTNLNDCLANFGHTVDQRIKADKDLLNEQIERNDKLTSALAAAETQIREFKGAINSARAESSAIKAEEALRQASPKQVKRSDPTRYERINKSKLTPEQIHNLNSLRRTTSLGETRREKQSRLLSQRPYPINSLVPAVAAPSPLTRKNVAPIPSPSPVPQKRRSSIHHEQEDAFVSLPLPLRVRGFSSRARAPSNTSPEGNFESINPAPSPVSQKKNLTYPPSQGTGFFHLTLPSKAELLSKGTPSSSNGPLENVPSHSPSLTLNQTDTFNASVEAGQFESIDPTRSQIPIPQENPTVPPERKAGFLHITLPSRAGLLSNIIPSSSDYPLENAKYETALSQYQKGLERKISEDHSASKIPFRSFAHAQELIANTLATSPNNRLFVATNKLLTILGSPPSPAFYKEFVAALRDAVKSPEYRNAMPHSRTVMFKEEEKQEYNAWGCYYLVEALCLIRWSRTVLHPYFNHCVDTYLEASKYERPFMDKVSAETFASNLLEVNEFIHYKTPEFDSQGVRIKKAQANSNLQKFQGTVGRKDFSGTENVPNVECYYEYENGQQRRTVTHWRHPSPVLSGDIQLAPDYEATLTALERQKKGVLYVIKQRLTPDRFEDESVRTNTIYKAQETHLNFFALVQAVEGDHFNRRGVFNKIATFAELQETLINEFYEGKRCNLPLRLEKNLEYKEAYKKDLEQLFSQVHQIFFNSREKLDSLEEWQSFILLCYDFQITNLIFNMSNAYPIEHLATVCKDDLDRGRGAKLTRQSLSRYWIGKEEDVDLLKSMTVATCGTPIAVKNQGALKERIGPALHVDERLYQLKKNNPALLDNLNFDGWKLNGIRIP
jgi:hypothetical protein